MLFVMAMLFAKFIKLNFTTVAVAMAVVMEAAVVAASASAVASEEEEVQGTTAKWVVSCTADHVA